MDEATYDALVEDLVRVAERRLLDPLEILTGPDEAPRAARGGGLAGLRAEVTARAQTWAAELLGDDERAAARTAARLVAALYPGDEPFDPPAQWWRTPLGRAVARRAGHPGAVAVSYSVAGAMLGVTRQGVHDLVTRGKLDRHPDGGVTVASVRARLNRPGPPAGGTAPAGGVPAVTQERRRPRTAPGR